MNHTQAKSHSRKRKINIKNVLILFLLLIIGIGGGSYFYLHSLFQPISLTQKVEVIIPSGATTQKISDLLAEAGVTQNKFVFTAYVKKLGIDSKLRPGTYHFAGQVSLDEIAKELLRSKGDSSKSIMVTFPEGLTVPQVADILLDKELIISKEKFLEVAQKDDFTQFSYLPKVGTENRLEGFLFPETYDISYNWDEKTIITMMLQQFDKIWSGEYRQKAEEMGKTTFEIITLASIIEKEAKVEADRPIIAGVFYNRLAQQMKLQSCATIQFILGEPRAKLYNKDLEQESPYNTYLHQGLPPGPIASPGQAAIKAALYPAKTDYLYFLAKPDGSHYFSKTLAEHNAGKKKYLS